MLVSSSSKNGHVIVDVLSACVLDWGRQKKNDVEQSLQSTSDGYIV